LIPGEVYLFPILSNVPRILGLLNRNISSSSYGCFDREFWHYNTVDIACARKQEALLTLTLLYLIEHKDNKYYHNREILSYIKAAIKFWTKIQNRNGSFNEWYPNEHSFVATSFSTYAVSESVLLIRNKIPEEDYQTVIKALRKAGDWLIKRNEIRVMNQQTGAVIALLNLNLLTKNTAYLKSAREKIALIKQRKSGEGWLVEYGGPDMGYLSLAIDYLCKYYKKTADDTVIEIINSSLGFIKYFVQPNLIAGGEYTSRNTEYLIPHGFEIVSKFNEDAFLLASIVRKTLRNTNSFPHLFDDRYLTYVGYTWLQAYLDANPEIDDKVDSTINEHFTHSFVKHFEESGLLIFNDNDKHLIINGKKGGSFRLFDKNARRIYSDSGILVESENKWYTSGWLAETQRDMDNDSLSVSGNMWEVPDKTLNTVNNILFRIFQITLGRFSVISLWMKERLRDMLITKAKPSGLRYNRKMFFEKDSNNLLKVMDSVWSENKSISSVNVFAKDTQVYVPSSRYYVEMKEVPFQKSFSHPVEHTIVEWRIRKETGAEVTNTI
jgi:hypothetical protein